MGHTINMKDWIAGFLFFLMIGVGLVVGESVKDIPAINSPLLRIRYQMPSEVKKTCEQVTLWYRIDQGQWRRGGTYKAGDFIEFATADDGVYEFSIEPSDGVGPGVDENGISFSSYKCLVDYNQPILQIISTDCKEGNLTIRWRAFDKNFSERPIEIYLLNRTGSVLLGQFSNQGVAVVPVQPGAFPARVKLVAIDRAGNYGVDVSERILPPEKSTTTTSSPASQPAKKMDTREEIKASAIEPSVVFSANPEAMREYRLGTAYRLRGELESAVTHLIKASELDPKMVAAFVELAGVFNTLKRYNESIDTYQQALVLDEKNVRAWQGLGMVRVHQGQYQQAMFCLEKVVELDDKNIQGWLYLGDAYWTLGYRNESKNAWNRAKGLLNENSLPELRQSVQSRMDMAK